VQSELDVEVRDEAYEVFVAEASRGRLADRSGPVRLTLRCGRVLSGTLVSRPDESVDGHLWVDDATGRVLLIPVAAVLVITGSRPGLRAERGDPAAASIGSWLRAAWRQDDPLVALLADGRWVGDRLVHVGADHADLANGVDVVTVPWSVVEAWARG